MFLLLLLTYCVSSVQPSAMSNIDKLHTDLLTGYNKDIRPPKDQTVTVVNTSFNLLTIKDLDEVSGKFDVMGLFIFTWFDDRLAWKPSDYNMIFSIAIPQDKIWKPTVLPANVFDSLKSVGHDSVPVRLYYNGKALWTPPGMFTSSCLVDVTYFPFDKQTCILKFVSFGALPTEVRLNPHVDKANTKFYTEHRTWNLEKTETNSYINGAASWFDVHITIKRRPLFFLVNVIFPVLLLALLNSLVFLLPAESVERISYAITVLLAIAVFMTMILNYLPKTSQTMSNLCYFLVGDLTLSSIICVLTIIQLRVFFKNDKKCPAPTCLKNIVSMCKRRKRILHVEPKVTWQDIAKVMDFFFSLFSNYYAYCTVQYSRLKRRRNIE